MHRMAIDPSTSRAERYAQGRALRTRCPRSSHATWQPRGESFDALKLIEQSNAGRIPGLVAVRYHRMSQSPFAFFRGCAVVQARDLATTPVIGVVLQLCGDCHILNFGGFATPERNLIFDINDFDETFPGPWEWDLKRLTASVVLAARDRGFPKAVARDAALGAVASYREKMDAYAQLSTLDVWYVRISFADLADFFKRNAETLGGPLPTAERYARDRTSETVFPKLARVENGRPTIVDDPPLIYHFHEHIEEAEALIREFFKRYRRSLASDRKRLFDRYVLQDIAIKVVGVGSVGTRCMVALFTSDSTDPLFLQAKEARRSALESPDARKSRFAHQGERVVSGQRLMQAASDIFLGWAEIPTASDYYVRQLRDMKTSVHIERFRASTLIDYATVCGWALARAHAKAGDAATIAGYIGGGDRFDRAIAKYAAAYADQVERDFEEFQAAIRAGRISVDVSDRPLDFLP
ncbi:MAG: DUF2252 domain-containing protein [Candidatus Eremiobacteraeota bacterium]|nr:DUF2252 domain-containing protein [Candidatus Eremiobacteraeota bacterium]